MVWWKEQFTILIVVQTEQYDIKAPEVSLAPSGELDTNKIIEAFDESRNARRE
jgi:hypothetical protein